MPYFKPFKVIIIGFDGVLGSALTGALDLFSFTDNNQLTDSFLISSKSNELEFESIGNNTLLGNGNCINFLKFIESSTVDLILTDPPYNLGKFMKGRGTNMGKMRNNHFAYSGWDDLDFENWCMQMDVFLKECHRILKKKGNLLIFMSIIKVT